MIRSMKFVIGSAMFAAALVFLLFGYFTQTSVQADQLAYSGKENHSITLAEATSLTARFRAEAAEWSVIAAYFGTDAIKKTLEQDGCVGLRAYFAKHQDGSPTLVLVGVDRKGNDIVSGLMSQKIVPCPPFCSEPNALNLSPQLANLDRK